MRAHCAIALVLCVLAATGSRAGAPAGDVVAAAPSGLAVSVYRSPSRNSGSIRLDALYGFALVSETRAVQLPAGISRLRFEGVADGIEAASAIVAGLPSGVIEKNRDANLLSPSALIAATVGKPVTLERTDRKTGKTERVEGRILSDAGGGVVFQTAEGIEALRCSGLPESMTFNGVSELTASPTLSVQIKAEHATTQNVTLSYLARGFDWAADYTATLSADGRTLDLGAWVTLANSNGVGFPQAHLQVIAGRLNRINGSIEPIGLQGPIIARCWPRGSTSDSPPLPRMIKAGKEMRIRSMDAMAAMAPSAGFREVDLSVAKQVQQEQLGDLKLYRIPDRTTLASRQSKQVRLFDRVLIPVANVYEMELAPSGDVPSQPANHLLRTTNTAANHLGLPLPSGSVSIFGLRDGQRLLLNESTVRDLAVDEEVELDLGQSADVRVSAVTLVGVTRATVSNARNDAINFELRLQLPAGASVSHPDHPLQMKNGRPIFRLKIPANQTLDLSYRIEKLRPP